MNNTLNKIFKHNQPNDVIVLAEEKKVDINATIQEIHETFFTEVDKLLDYAKISHSLESDKQDLIEKCNRLKALGFTNTKEVKDAQSEVDRIEKIKKENDAKAELISAINYFSSKYPNYKFITEDSVKRICEKYNLVYGTIDRYIGTVPDKNLEHIEDFKVFEEDECYSVEKGFQSISLTPSSIFYVDSTIAKRLQRDSNVMRISGFYIYVFKSKLEIAAPLKDFNTSGMEVKNNKLSTIEIPDPIVLKPVMFNGNKYYLIVTAWGIEAGDEVVVNENHN